MPTVHGSITFEKYQELDKGRLAKLDYKPPSERKSRRKGPKLTTTKKRKNAVSPPKPSTDLIAGNSYFIEDKSRRKNSYKSVFTGKYKGMSNDDKRKLTFLEFEDVKLLVSPEWGVFQHTDDSGERFFHSKFATQVFKFIEKPN